MLRGFYTAAAGMLAQQRKTEMLTNNMANAQTPGFKTDTAAQRAFPEMLLRRYEELSVPTENTLHLTQSRAIGSVNTGVYLQETIPKFLQGDLRETGLTTDLALLDVNIPQNENGVRGALFFTVQNPDGEIRYTRNGNFALDGAGFLTTASGMYVLDTEGNPIQLESDQFIVNDAGLLTGINGEQAQVGIAYANNPQDLIKEGDGLYRLDGGALVNGYTAENVQFRLQQGYLEQSNVDVSKTMTQMLAAYRSFEANQKVLQAYDRSMEKAVNDIGRIN
ncbi:flagellar hook-basal body protein [Bacillaceae bacterium Marseille-Q3522]|nr:flagellar hook-basal body protein [Bacillaceae bacterium Marseille-Q3522]